MNKKLRIAFRCDDNVYQEIINKARKTNLKTGSFIRRAVLNRVIQSVVPLQSVSELRRLGALIKSCYPTGIIWTMEEKRRYWEVQEQIIALVVALERLMG